MRPRTAQLKVGRPPRSPQKPPPKNSAPLFANHRFSCPISTLPPLPSISFFRDLSMPLPNFPDFPPTQPPATVSSAELDSNAAVNLTTPKTAIPRNAAHLPQNSAPTAVRYSAPKPHVPTTATVVQHAVLPIFSSFSSQNSATSAPKTTLQPFDAFKPPPGFPNIRPLIPTTCPTPKPTTIEGCTSSERTTIPSTPITIEIERQTSTLAAQKSPPPLQCIPLATAISLQQPILENQPSASRDAMDVDQEDGEVQDETDDTRMLNEALYDIGTTPEPTAAATPRKVLIDPLQFFKILPTGWKKVTHRSGIPLYYCAAKRTVSLAPPYSLEENDNLIAHQLPASAIPCLEHRGSKNDEQSAVWTAEEIAAKATLTHEQVHDYCARLFSFQSTPVKSSGVKNLATTTDEETGCTSSKSSVKQAKVIRYSFTPKDSHDPIQIILNIVGKTPLAILTQLAQRMKVKTHFEFRERALLEERTDASRAPRIEHECQLFVDDQFEGHGAGGSKKKAQSAAAETYVTKLIPELTGAFEEMKSAQQERQKQLEIFAGLKTDDPRIGEIAHASGGISPFDLLSKVCKSLDHATASLSKSAIVFHKVSSVAPQENLYRMSAGPFTADTEESSKTIAKQICAQKLLQQLHPEATFYTEIIDIYLGAPAEREKKLEEQRQIVQVAHSRIEPVQVNELLLEKLRQEMRKLIPAGPAGLSSIRYN